MAEHFKFYPNAADTVTPWNARYHFPSQSNKATKVTPRIPPKNGGVFSPTTAPYIRLEFPADGYVNPLNTTISFDVTLTGYGTPGTSIVRFQNNIQSIFRRVRILYGSTPLEDILDYNVIVRALTEWTASNSFMTLNGTSIDQGIGGAVAGFAGAAGTAGLINSRQAYIQGIDNTASTGFGHVPNGSGQSTTRRYQINLAAGLFTQDKLIPAKFMASQLAVELELAPSADCIFVLNAGTGTEPAYTVSNIVLLPEIVHFDPAYDEQFLRGLRKGGVPIKMSSWHSFSFATGGASNLNLQIQERSRSVKAIFTVQRRTPTTFTTDSGALLASSAGCIQSYQYRIGGRYFPAAPVLLTTTPSGSVSNSGCEAWCELEKALNIVGDYRLSQGVNTLRWALPYASASSETDFANSIYSFNSSGVPNTVAATVPFVGNVGSAAFAAAISLENSSGVDISGLNAEEQSDISFLATYSANQLSGYTLSVFTFFDIMLVLNENNVIQLIQ